MHIKVLVGDITKLKVDAIVNAAKNSLLGGGGVDGAIHRAAGPDLLAECRTLNGCETGDAKITMGYQLPAKYVIHTVGPVWNGGNQNEPELLAACYRSCLRIAKEKRLSSIAFPAISTGIYGYPKDQAAEIAVRTIIGETKDADEDFEVILVAFNTETEQLYNQAIQSVAIGIDRHVRCILY
ncbi:MAG: O-acetyl-ADP-ribose deacetylase [Lachnospiraceae bacterium]|nr:O-acetyl-ADP-ribose deacetylase [Lachnospiraceae bacterium]